MAKPKLYGKKTAYIPNSKADMRCQKNIYQHNRKIAERDPGEMLERKLLARKEGNGG